MKLVIRVLCTVLVLLFAATWLAAAQEKPAVDAPRKLVAVPVPPELIKKWTGMSATAQFPASYVTLEFFSDGTWKADTSTQFGTFATAGNVKFSDEKNPLNGKLLLEGKYLDGRWVGAGITYTLEFRDGLLRGAGKSGTVGDFSFPSGLRAVSR